MQFNNPTMQGCRANLPVLVILCVYLELWALLIYQDKIKTRLQIRKVILFPSVTENSRSVLLTNFTASLVMPFITCFGKSLKDPRSHLLT